jgi:type II secretory pathway pseudopilin PulG
LLYKVLRATIVEELNYMANSKPKNSKPKSHKSTGFSPANQKTNTLAIVGLIFSFLAPLIGLILSIIALSDIKKKHEGGRGLAIAGIVISTIFTLLFVIGIILALVLVTTTGVQQKARDTERKTDIKAIASYAETYNAQTGYYPSLDEINNTVWRSTNFKDLDQEAYKDPQGTEIYLVSTQLPYNYAYEVRPENCDNKAVKCTSYNLTAILEEMNSAYSLESLSPAQ